MIVIGCNTSDNGKSCFTEDVSHFRELRQNRQIAKRSAKNQNYTNVNLLDIDKPLDLCISLTSSTAVTPNTMSLVFERGCDTTTTDPSCTVTGTTTRCVCTGDRCNGLGLDAIVNNVTS